jgi:hypothetical protein
MGDRAKLNFGDDEDLTTPPPPPVPVEQIKAVTRQAGFHETPKPAKASLAPVKPSVQRQRRRRRKTGRVHQFATRLRMETIEGFQAYADRWNLTIAETLERALMALMTAEPPSVA